MPHSFTPQPEAFPIQLAQRVMALLRGQMRWLPRRPWTRFWTSTDRITRKRIRLIALRVRRGSQSSCNFSHFKNHECASLAHTYIPECQ